MVLSRDRLAKSAWWVFGGKVRTSKSTTAWRCCPNVERLENRVVLDGEPIDSGLLVSDGGVVESVVPTEEYSSSTDAGPSAPTSEQPSATAESEPVYLPPEGETTSSDPTSSYPATSDATSTDPYATDAYFYDYGSSSGDEPATDSEPPPSGPATETDTTTSESEPVPESEPTPSGTSNDGSDELPPDDSTATDTTGSSTEETGTGSETGEGGSDSEEYNSAPVILSVNYFTNSDGTITLTGTVCDDGPLERITISIDGIVGPLTATVNAEGEFVVTTSHPIIPGFVTFQAQDDAGLLSDYVWTMVM